MSNYSKQREEILEVLKGMYNHPAAEEIYEELKKQGSSSSKSTVYRNLKILVNEEIINKVATINGIDKYDYKRLEHNHILCTKCGKIFDIHYDFMLTNECLDFINKNMQIKPYLHNVTISGICNNCQNHQ